MMRRTDRETNKVFCCGWNARRWTRVIGYTQVVIFGLAFLLFILCMAKHLGPHTASSYAYNIARWLRPENSHQPFLDILWIYSGLICLHFSTATIFGACLINGVKTNRTTVVFTWLFHVVIVWILDIVAITYISSSYGIAITFSLVYLGLYYFPVCVILTLVEELYELYEQQEEDRQLEDFAPKPRTDC